MGKKKQAKSLTTAEKKEERGKKTYSLSKPESTTDSDAQPKVFIHPDLERHLVQLILEHQQGKQNHGDVSKRLSIKKLTDLYNHLSNAGFEHKQIEAAMTSTVAAGGDLITALDWLCLNTKNEELPEGFSHTLQQEEEKTRRPKFDMTLQSMEASGVSKAQEQSNVHDEAKSEVKSAPKEKASMKDWIMNYAEFSDDSEEEETDPSEKYLVLTAKLFDAKSQATIAKQQADKAKQKSLSKQIREIMLEMESLELQPGFNPAVKVKETETTSQSQANNSPSQSETNNISNQSEVSSISNQSEASNSQSAGTDSRQSKPEGSDSVCRSENTGNKHGKMSRRNKGESEDEGFDLSGFGMMEAEAAAAAPQKPAAKVVKPETLDVRNFEYTRQQWTGKSPKQFLIDWVRKHLPRSDPPKFDKIHYRQKWKCKCKVDRKKDGGMLEVTPDILCENNMEAQHLAATLALYHLCQGQPVHQLLPPPYRTVWLEWRDADSAVKQEAKEKENKPRDQFVSRLLKKVQADGKTSSSSQSKVKDTDSEDMTWEDLADQDDWGPQKSKSKSRASHSKMDSPALKRMFESRTLTNSYQKLLRDRQKLPVYQHRDSVMAAIRGENVVVVAGETGSGKSTQIPQFVLEDAVYQGNGDKCNIVCTQPRRISAMSLANRVSDELGENGPGKRDSLCGYQIRFESKMGPNTKLVYCTTGVVLRRLQQDPEMKDVTHIIIDEVHERSVQSDFLMIVVKEILSRRKDLKVILMSATLDSRKFSAYFNHCPVINIPGRTFPVEVCHVEDVVEMLGYIVDEDSPYTLRAGQLVQEESATVEVTERGGDSSQVDVFWTKEDISKIDRTELSADDYSLKTRNTVTRLNMKRINMDLIMELLHHLDKKEPYCSTDGAVLVFLPGLADIQELYESLQTDRKFSDTSKYLVLALHSVLSSEDQNQAFSSPPTGVRKVVLATNIAETGITIPDVVFVIDAGKAKENRYLESSQMSCLEEVYISQASAKQRQGRAGRVRDGFCFRLYTKHMYEKFRPYTVPELLRVPLEELCLNIMKCKFGKPGEFLSHAIDPPVTLAVSRAMALLCDVGACDIEGLELTPLGHHLAALPVHVRIGKMLLFASFFGCLEQVAVIAAGMTVKSPFVTPLGKRDQADTAKMAMSVACSDHITLYKAYLGWIKARNEGRQAEKSYCSKNFLKRNTLIDIENVKTDLVKLVTTIGFENIVPAAVKSKSRKPDILDISSTGGTEDELSQHSIAVVKAVMTAGLYPCVAKVSHTAQVDAAANPEKILCTAETTQGMAAIHPSSVNRYLEANGWVVYHEKVKLSRVYLRDSTLTTPFPLMLFGGDIDVQHTQQLVTVDGWMQFQTKAKTGVIFKELRILLVDMLQQKLEEPATDLRGSQVIPLLRQLLTSEKT